VPSLDDIWGTGSTPASGKSLDEIWGGGTPGNAPTRAPQPAAKSKSWHDWPAVRKGLAISEWAANSPVARGADAVLNATSRAGVGAVAGATHGQNPLTSAAQGFVSPAQATDTTHAAQSGMLRALTGALGVEGGGTDFGAGHWNAWAQVPADFLTETALDPATYIPGLDAFSIGKRLARYTGIARAARALGKTPIGDKVLTGTVEGHDLRKGLQRPGEDIVKGIEGAQHNARVHEEQAYGDLIERHRPVLDAIDEKRKELYAQFPATEITPQERFTSPPAWIEAKETERERLKKELAAVQALVPPEIRQATLRRAYLEGTPQVRALAIAHGYRPTTQERLAPVLNVLHGFNEWYEPEQSLYGYMKDGKHVAGSLSAEGAANAVNTHGPVEWIRQGNRRAKFDLRKEGANPQDPLAERLLDRFVKGARITEYHTTRRNIAKELGIAPGPDIARTQGRIDQLAKAGGQNAPTPPLTRLPGGRMGWLTGTVPHQEVHYAPAPTAAHDPKRIARYEALLGKQREAASAAEGRRAATLKPDAEQVTLSGKAAPEFVDPRTSERRAINEGKFFGKNLEGIRAGMRKKDLKELRGRWAGSRIALTQAQRAAVAARKGVAGTSKAAGAFSKKHEGQFSRAMTGITKAANRQSGRVAKLGAELENHDLVRAGLKSDIPKLRESTRELQAAYVAAKRLASSAYKSGFGKNVDQVAHQIAAHRLDHPVGTNLTVIGEGENTRVLGGRAGGTGPYARAEIAQTLAAMRKSGKKDAKAVDAQHVLDEAMNAIGEARDKVDRVAESYDIKQKGVSYSPEGLTSSIERMRDLFKSTAEDVKKDLARKPPVPGPIRSSIGQVVRGDKSLGASIEKASIPKPISAERVVLPSERAAQASEEAFAKAKDRTVNTREKYNEETRKNAAIDDMRKKAAQAMAKHNEITMPAALQRRLFADIPEYSKSLAASFSDVQRKALFLLPFAHMKNITVLTALGPNGAKVVSRGLQLAIQAMKDPAAFEQRIAGLEQIGASQHYAKEGGAFSDALGWAGKAGARVGGGLDKISDMSSTALDRYDQAMRLALQEELASKGVTGYAAGGQIRDILGDYTNQAPAIKELRKRAGANFPAWGLGIVPRAMGKALREKPGAFKQYARTNRLVSDDVTQPWFGEDVDVGGPAEDEFKMLNFPVGTFRYATSRSRLGPLVSDVPGALEAATRGQMVPYLAKEGLSATPFTSVIGAATGFPYPSKAPALLRTGAGLAGSYFPSTPSIKQRTNQLRSLGMGHDEIQKQLQWEGYFKAKPQGFTAPSSPSNDAGKSLDDIWGAAQ
jgi:hypothetical protein